MIAELQQAVANHAHALDELNMPEPPAVLPEDTSSNWSGAARRSPGAASC
ncbi:hypothetical protein OG689_39795 [Kitasatospora sp. NBC_00240]|nr:hypothetical protein [Kitasatospora sp. NBC_00240]MCX5215322.1 hypothetical protein [Kitasatospora sp. NBC_00240]